MKIHCIVGTEPYHNGMTNSPALEARVTKLEYYVFEQLPPRLAAMNLAATQIYALTEANGQAIAGLRVDMAVMQSGVHADMFALKAALDLQGDSLRKEIGVTAASLRSDMTAFREAVSQRFEDSDTQLRGARSDIGAVKEEVDFLRDDVGFLKEQFTGLDSKVTGLDAKVTGLDAKVTGLDSKVTGLDAKLSGLDVKLDAVIAEIRDSKNQPPAQGR
jgi:hypothetical protein